MFDPITKAILDAVKNNSPKKNCTISTITSATNGSVNSVTINVELSTDEAELVVKTISSVEAMVEGAKGQARAGGFPATLEEWVAPAGDPPGLAR